MYVNKISKKDMKIRFSRRCETFDDLKKSTIYSILAISCAFYRRYAVEGLVKDLVEDLVGEDEDSLQLSKRQQLDDYGHMRFGKRSNGDDEEYGHSRFGRNIE